MPRRRAGRRRRQARDGPLRHVVVGAWRRPRGAAAGCGLLAAGLGGPAEPPGRLSDRGEVAAGFPLRQEGCGGEQQPGCDEGPGLPQRPQWCVGLRV